jgi:phage host-nuclease inhibitor protein Gam
VRVVWLRKQGLVEALFDPHTDIWEAMWALRQGAVTLYNYFNVHMIEPKRVEAEVEPGKKLSYVIEGVTPAPDSVFYRIYMDVVTVEMSLKDKNWDMARNYAEKIRARLSEVEPVMEKVTDQNARQIFEDMKGAADYLIEQLKERSPQFSTENVAYWITIKIMSALRVLQWAVEEFKKFFITNRSEIDKYPRIAREIEEWIEGAEEDIEDLKQAMERGEFIKILKNVIEPEREIQLIYKFVYKPLMDILPEEKREEASNYLWHIFEAYGALRSILGMLT